MMLITTPVLLVACLAASSLSGATPLRVGTINGEPAQAIKKFWPFTEYLAKHLQGEGIGRGSVVIANSIPQMASFMREGKIDLLIASSFPSATISKLAGSKFLLRRWKGGRGEYRSIIFVRKDAGLTQLKDLKGKVVAFQEPFSTSGYYVPRLFLIRAGLKLALKENAGGPVASDRIGYRFSYSDSNTMLWVLRGVVTAGAMDEQTYQAEARGSLNSLKIISQTPFLPRQMISYRAGLTPRVVDKIKQVLLHMHESEEGRKILASFDNARFDELSPPALAFLREIMQATRAGEDLQ